MHEPCSTLHVQESELIEGVLFPVLHPKSLSQERVKKFLGLKHSTPKVIYVNKIGNYISMYTYTKVPRQRSQVDHQTTSKEDKSSTNRIDIIDDNTVDNITTSSTGIGARDSFIIEEDTSFPSGNRSKKFTKDGEKISSDGNSILRKIVDKIQLKFEAFKYIYSGAAKQSEASGNPTILQRNNVSLQKEARNLGKKLKQKLGDYLRDKEFGRKYNDWVTKYNTKCNEINTWFRTKIGCTEPPLTGEQIFIIFDDGGNIQRPETEEELLRNQILQTHTVTGALCKIVLEILVGADNLLDLLPKEGNVSYISAIFKGIKLFLLRVIAAAINNPELLGLATAFVVVLINYGKLMEHAKDFYANRVSQDSIQPIFTVFPVEGVLGAISMNTIPLMFGSLVLGGAWKAVMRAPLEKARKERENQRISEREKEEEVVSIFGLLNTTVITTSVAVGCISLFIEAINLAAYSSQKYPKKFYHPSNGKGNVKIAADVKQSHSVDEVKPVQKPIVEEQPKISHRFNMSKFTVLKKCWNCRCRLDDVNQLSCNNCDTKFKRNCNECNKEFTPAFRSHLKCDTCFTKKKDPVIKQQEEKIKSTPIPKEKKNDIYEDAMNDIKKINNVIKENKKKEKKKQSHKGTRVTPKPWINYENMDPEYDYEKDEKYRDEHDEEFLTDRQSQYDLYIHSQIIDEYGSISNFISANDLYDHRDFEGKMYDSDYEVAYAVMREANHRDGTDKEWFSNYKNNNDYHQEVGDDFWNGKSKGGKKYKGKNEYTNYQDWKDVKRFNWQHHSGSPSAAYHDLLHNIALYLKPKSKIFRPNMEIKNGKRVIKVRPGLKDRVSRRSKLIKELFNKDSKKESHSKISVSLGDNIVSVCNADKFKVAHGVLITPRLVLGCNHYGDVNFVSQKLSISPVKFASIVKIVKLNGPRFDQLTLYELDSDLVHRPMKLGVHSGSADAVIMGGDNHKYMQLSSVVKDEAGYLRWNGDSVHGDCGGMILNTNGHLIGLHAGKDVSSSVTKGLFGLPLTADHLDFFRQKGVTAF